MENKRETKRDALRERLTKAAEGLIKERGLSGLKARDITTRAECALGALYTAVEDLSHLVVLVNSRTLSHLGQVLRSAVPKGATPEQTMHALAQAYVQFAVNHTNLWSAIFNHRLPEGDEAPEWHQAEYAVLIQEIIAPLSVLRPDLDPEQLRQRSQTLFASVHGVVQLSIQGLYVGAPPERLAEEVDALVEAMTRGIRLLENKEMIGPQA